MYFRRTIATGYGKIMKSSRARRDLAVFSSLNFGTIEVDESVPEDSEIPYVFTSPDRYDTRKFRYIL